MRNKFYFTFGSYEKFPYQRGEYLIVIATDIREAARKFKETYPNPDDDTVLNCADYYTEEEWKKVVSKYYPNKKPVEVIA